MHKGIILICEAEDADTARGIVEDFAEMHLNDMFEYYTIGGRWSGCLNNFFHIYEEEAKKRNINSSDDEGNIELQKYWEDLGGYDFHPFSRDNYNDSRYLDDVLPLGECLDIIRNWRVNRDNAIQNAYHKLVKNYEEHITNGAILNGWYGREYYEAVSDDLTPDSNVYNITDETNTITDELLENPGGYYAVMVDFKY